MFVARLRFLTHTGVRQGDNPGPGLFRRSYDAGVAERHADLDQHPWAQRLACTYESRTLPPLAVPLTTTGYADLARTSIARSHMELQRHEPVDHFFAFGSLRARFFSASSQKGRSRYCGFRAGILLVTYGRLYSAMGRLLSALSPVHVTWVPRGPSRGL